MVSSVTYAVLPYVTMNNEQKIPMVAGQAEFFDNTTRLKKNVWRDAARTNAYANPLTFDKAGRVPPLYFENDASYFIKITDVLTGEVINVPNFTPNGGGGITPIDTSTDFDNLIINGQLRFYTNATVTSIPKSSKFLIAPDNFYFFEDGVNATDNIFFGQFTLDDTNVDANPINYFEYYSPSAGVNETVKDFIYQIKDVRSLASEEVTFSFAGLSFTGVPQQVEVLIEQNFGTGGTPSETNQPSIQSFTLTGSWGNPFEVTFTVPSLAGKTVGINGDDYVAMHIRLPLQVSSRIRLTNVYWKRGQPNIYYPYETYDETLAKIQALNFPVATNDNNFDVVTYVTPSYNQTGEYELLPATPVGSSMYWDTSNVPPGWVFRDGDLYPISGTYERLFAGQPGSIGYTRTNLNGWSIYADPSDVTAFYMVSDNVGIMPITPTSDNPGQAAISAIVPGTTTTRGSFRVNFPVNPVTSGLTGVSINCQSFGSTVSDAIFFEVSQNNSVIEAIQRVFRIFSGGTFAQPGFRNNVVAQLIDQRAASDDNFLASSATNVITVTALKMGEQKSAPTAGTTAFTVVLTTPGAAVGPTGAYEVITVTCTAATTLVAGQYILLSTPSNTFCFWIILDKKGLAPTNVTADYFVPVKLIGTMSNADVATAFTAVINKVLYAVPDSRALFQRVKSKVSLYDDPSVDGNIHVDPDYGNRSARLDGTGGNVPGSIQYDQLASHNHSSPTGSFAAGGGTPIVQGGGDDGFQFFGATNTTGGNQTRPVNEYLQMIIKY